MRPAGPKPGSPAAAPLRVGAWRVDPATNELARDGETVRIEPKAMEVLAALAGRAGHVVGRDELLRTVWPGVVVGDEALTQSIIKLRKALGDNPRAPAYIETISKRGYRLIAPVAGQPHLDPPARSRYAGWPAAGAASALLVALLYGAAVREGPQQRAGDAFSPHGSAPFTVAVLPFETLGEDAGQGYLARGIRSDLVTDLSTLGGLRLIGSAGTDSSGTPPGARYVVTGTVQREGAMLRINVRLMDSLSNEPLWSQRFERPFADLFAVQDEIRSRLVEQLPGRIAQAEHSRAAKRYTRSLEAYDHFLRAQARFLVRRGEDNGEAQRLYARAVALDPTFARAYAGLAMTYAMEPRYGAADGAALGRALQLAETARQIDPGIAEVHWALGFIYTQSRRHEEALLSLREAIELNPSYADAYALMGGIYTYVGRPASSIPLLRTALRLNPEGGSLYYLLLGRAYLFQNDVEQARINLREALARNPENLEARVYLAAALLAGGDVPRAEWEADQIRAHEPGFSTRSWLETYPMTSPRHREQLAALLAQLQL